MTDDPEESEELDELDEIEDLDELDEELSEDPAERARQTLGPFADVLEEPEVEEEDQKRDRGEEVLKAIAADPHIVRKLFNVQFGMLNMYGIESVVRTCTAQLENDHDVDYAWVILLERSETADLVRELGLDKKLEERLCIVSMNAFDEMVMSEDTPVFIDEEMSKFRDLLPEKFQGPATSMVLTPLVIAGKQVGCLAMADTEIDRWREDRDIFLVSVIGTTFSLGFNLAVMQDHVERIAVADPLTGLPNRRTLDEELRAEIARSERYGDKLSLLLINADGTSDINERFGQEQGDRFIRHIAEGLRACTRTEDSCFRVGGDEFAVVLPAQDRAQARVVAERIVEWMEANPIRLHDPMGFKAVKPAVSIGAADLDEDKVYNARTLLSRADDRLYEVKLQRHRVENPRPKPK